MASSHSYSQSTISHQELKNTIVFTCSSDLDKGLFQPITTLYSEAFALLDYEFKMLFRPSKRALAEAMANVQELLH